MLDVIFNMVTQEENHRRFMMGRDNRSENMVVFAAREHSNERPTCRHYGRYGHDETNCYEIIGYPPNWGSCGRGRGSRGGGRANRGGRNGGRGRGREIAHSVQAHNVSPAAASRGPAEHSPDAVFGPAAAFGPAASSGPANLASHGPAVNYGPTAAAAIPGLTQDQLQKLLSLIESPKPGFEKVTGNIPWMFDSGAPCHMTGNLNLIQEIKKIDSIAIGMPNGTHTLACQEGSAALGELKFYMFLPLSAILYPLQNYVRN